MVSPGVRIIPRALKLALFGTSLGLLLTWLANLFIFNETQIHRIAFPIFGRDFKAMAYEIGTMPLSLAETALLSAGGLLVLLNYGVFLYNAGDKETRKDVAGFFLGTCSCLLALPILHIWEPQTDKFSVPPSGPIAIHLILAIGGATVVIVYVFKTGLFLQHTIIPPRTRVAIHVIIALAVASGNSFFVFGVSGFVRFGTFNIGRIVLISSPTLCLSALVLAAVSYARDRGELLEMEENREVRRSIKARKLEEQRQMVTNRV